MAFLRTVLGSVVLVGLGAAWLQAQSTRGRVIVAPQGRPRIATIAPPPPPPVRVVDYGPTVFANDERIILPDGRILIDLGNGLQEVASGCVYAYGYGCLSYGYPTVSYTTIYYTAPAYVVPVYPPVVYTTPVYPEAGYSPRCYGCFDPSRTSVRSYPIPTPRAARAAPARAAPPRTLVPVYPRR
ncbi:MAG TPA: hypothetical protein VGH98_13065 [Gemmatimonadaceae bacterium]